LLSFQAFNQSAVVKVLLVEDVSDDQLFFRAIFPNRKHINVAISNGLELIEYLHVARADNCLFDLIVSGWKKPKMNSQ
jgi:hypothetical protein